MQNYSLDNPFWQYACSTYKIPGVEEFLLALQDDHGLNVNLVLLMCWLAEQNRHITEQQLVKFIDAITITEQQIMQPLRSARYAMKSDTLIPETLYRQYSKLELQIEQVIINRLHQESLTVRTYIENSDSLTHNTKVYFDNTGIKDSNELSQQLQRLIQVK